MRYLSATATREAPENTEAGGNIGAPVTANDPDTGNTLTYTLEGADLDSFDIDSASGQIQTMPGVTYDHETKSSYSVTVKADYNNGGTATIDVTITITVTVTDVDEPLTVHGQTSVGYPENSDGQVATYSATDPDNGQIIWSLSGDDAGDFSISNTGELTFQTAPDHEAPADYNTDNRYELTVEASDGSVKGTLDVTVTVTDVNEPPGFSVETASRTIAENTTTGVAIGDPVTATDSDTGDTPAYTLGGTDANFFDIDTSSGQLRTKAALDYEVKNTYQISVSVRDGKNAEGNPDAADDATITVTITVTNVEEPGKVSLNLLQPQVGTGLTTIVTDPDGGVRGMTWEWESSSDNKNTWTPISGAVSGTYFPVDADVGNYLRVTVSYTDAEGWQLFIIWYIIVLYGRYQQAHQPDCLGPSLRLQQGHHLPSAPAGQIAPRPSDRATPQRPVLRHRSSRGRCALRSVRKGLLRGPARRPRPPGRQAGRVGHSA